MTAPSQPLLTCRVLLRVRYADTDQMEIVYNGKYLEYFEVGRTEMLRGAGLPYARLEASGTRLPLIEAACRFLRPARYDDLLVIESVLQGIPSARLRIDYRVFREGEDQPLATGHTVHAFQDVRTGRPVRPPALLLSALDGPPRVITASVAPATHRTLPHDPPPAVRNPH
jgi:acyl-CoA thioester hydrolase